MFLHLFQMQCQQVIRQIVFDDKAAKTMRKCYLGKASSPLYHRASIDDGVCFQLEKCHNDHSLLICHGRSEVGKTTAINIWRELRLDGLAGPILKYYSHPSQ